MYIYIHIYIFIFYSLNSTVSEAQKFDHTKNRLNRITLLALTLRTVHVGFLACRPTLVHEATPSSIRCVKTLVLCAMASVEARSEHHISSVQGE